MTSFVRDAIDDSFSFICPVNDHELCNSIVKVVGGSARILPHGSTGTVYFENVAMKLIINNKHQ